MDKTLMIQTAYVVAGFFFIVGLKMLGSPATARRGNMFSAIAMAVAVVATLFSKDIVDFKWIVVGIIAGAVIGAAAALLVEMTSMPEMVALLNGFGGVASLLVGWAEYSKLLHHGGKPGGEILMGIKKLTPLKELHFDAFVIFLAVIIGGLTLTGSIVAWAKLKDIKIGGFKVGPAFTFGGQQVVNGLLLVGALGCGIVYCISPDNANVFYAILILSCIIGIMSVIPIGGADMPVVISLLNSYSGLAACAAGFIINNTILIVAGSMVGASGIILTNIMCKAMNRSLANVLFSGFGSASSGGKGKEVTGEAKPISAQDCYYVLEAANSVAIVPGYGLAVAQAQHAVRELGECLEANGTEVSYAIHPVAGRMPGHMNVLLAEADVPYDQLIEMDDINPVMETIDVVMVIGANDVVNPDAREDEDSPIYGMPIINVDEAKTVIVLKRSMSTGFAGIQNPLFFKDNTRMLFGDAKGSVNDLVAEFKG